MPYADPKIRKNFYDKWRKAHKEHLREYARKWREKNRIYDNGRTALSRRRNTRKLRRDIAKLLGNKCQRCGMNDERTFNFHHKDKNGHEHRRGQGPNTAYYRSMIEMIKNSPGSIELLCANCHAIEHWVPDEQVHDESKLNAFKVRRRKMPTPQQIRSIRRRKLLHGWSIAAIAKRFSMTRPAIRNIVNGVTHRNVE
jgi:hypothetical protein